METKQGILAKVENFLKTFCDKNTEYRYKINKTNILIYHVYEKSAIIDIYGRIKNQEIRIYISDKSPEYRIYLLHLKDKIDSSRSKSNSKGKLNFSFYINDCHIEEYIEELLRARL